MLNSSVERPLGLPLTSCPGGIDAAQAVCTAAAGACHAFTTVALPLVKVTGAAVTSSSATTPRLWDLRAGTAGNQEKRSVPLGCSGLQTHTAGRCSQALLPRTRKRAAWYIGVRLLVSLQLASHRS